MSALDVTPHRHQYLLGGIIIGLIESVAPQFMTATWTEAIVYGLFLVFLFVKPSGLFGMKYDW